MLTSGYLAYQAERAKAQAEQRETDAQMGQLSAAFAQLLGSLTQPVRALRASQVRASQVRASRACDRACQPITGATGAE